VATSVVLDAKIGRIFRRVVEPDEGFELQLARSRRKINERNAVAESIMDPTRLAWRRRYMQSAFEQPLVEAVPWTKHELMQPRPDRIFVVMGRGMVD